ncbi:hypothetical protein [Dactylosporangium sp. NPDC000521]|uniref:hypothetical protein n=1 Tax=Dactylosporangium sp. NPDC000521 TaxID=3363975 RepID=UPI00369A8B5F
MSFDSVKSGLDSLSNRFLQVSLLPAITCTLLLTALVLAGAPSARLDWTAAWRRLTGASAGQVVSVAFLGLLAALLLRPLQLAAVRAFEGYWPVWLRPLGVPARAVHQRRRARLVSAAERLPSHPDAPGAEAMVQAAGRAGALLRQRYPDDARLLPTALGNVLAAAEERAGAAYGFDAVVAWPKLYPLLPAPTKAIVDDRRNTLDAAVMMAAALAVAGLAGFVLLLPSGWWLLLAAVPWILAAVTYRGAVEAAAGYGEAIDAAFELHRFELYAMLRLPLPADRVAEVNVNQRLALQWRQGVVDPAPQSYVHPGSSVRSEA